jgi:glycogen debranching enzyme
VIAAAVAPDLFVREHVKEALKIFEDALLGPGQLGVKTLDPADWNYRGEYDNSNNSEDPKVAHGANYHNGPEWVWPLGYYLRARLNYSVDSKKENTYFNRLLSRHLRHIESSPWGGLPELTNAGGAFCKDSCTIQAWSIATILDALYDLNARARKDMGPRKILD